MLSTLRKSGELAPDLAEVAPYLVQLEPASAFTNWLLEHGWGHNWGVFATSATDLRALRRHFRTFLIVHDEEGKPLYFRFYDPACCACTCRHAILMS